MRERIESRHGIHTVEHAEKIGLGSRQYKLVSIDGKEENPHLSHPKQRSHPPREPHLLGGWLFMLHDLFPAGTIFSGS